MKNQVRRILTIFLSAVTLSATIPLTEIPAKAETTHTAEVWVDGSLSIYSDDKNFNRAFESMWREALSAAKADKNTTASSRHDVVFKLGRDWDSYSDDCNFSTTDGFKDGAIDIPEYVHITVDLNGYVINRHLASDKKNSRSKGTIFNVNEYAQLTIIDSAPERIHKGRISQGIWYEDDVYGGSVNISGGVIAGGYEKNYGGAIYMEEYSTVIMNGGTIAGNIADCGGGVYLEGDYTSLIMGENASIRYNKADSGSYGGGGICTNGENLKIVGGNISDNTAKYGGGIYLWNDDVSVAGVKLEGNQASSDGGGIYELETEVSVSDCEFYANRSGGSGGAIYINDDTCSMSGCTVEGNSASGKGDGIFVLSGQDLSISGKMIVRNNGSQNLYLDGNNDLIAGVMDRESVVYITLASAASNYNGIDNPFVSAESPASAKYFYSDESGYYAVRQDNPNSKNYRYLYFERGTRPEPATETVNNSSVNTEYGTYTGSSGEYNLSRGYFRYASVSDDQTNHTSVFYYSDGYFDADPKVYNNHLATMSLNLAMSAFAQNAKGGINYSNQFGNVKQLLSDIGCADNDIYVNDAFLKKPEYYGKNAQPLSTIGVAIAQKKISVGGQEYTLVPVAIRGAGYESEWGSNVTLGADNEAQGFGDAATQIVQEVENYLNVYGLEDDIANGTVKFWVVGYSRAGAAANITSKRLTDTYGNGNQIFGYCFEAPQGGCDAAALNAEWTDNGTYLNIHNIINQSDLVPKVGPNDMGLKRYGVDHYVPGNDSAGTVSKESTSLNGGIVTTYHDNDASAYKVSYDTNSSYFKQRNKMISQLRLVNPDIEFDDYIRTATINYLGNAVSLMEMIDETGSYVDPADFTNDFFKYFQEWSLTGKTETNYRHYYAQYKPWSADRWKPSYSTDKNDTREKAPKDLGYFSSDMTVEDAIGVAVNLVFNKSPENLEGITNVLSTAFSAMDKVSADDIPFISWFAFQGNVTKLELYDDYIGEWQDFSDSEKVEYGNRLLDYFIEPVYPGAPTIWDYLSDTEEQQLKQALPILLDLALTFASEDYETPWLPDNKQYYVGTFAYNASNLLMMHYPEVNLSWLRTYDNFYDNETVCYITQAFIPEIPTVEYNVQDNVITINAAAGSAAYYSTDNGSTWYYYQRPSVLPDGAESIRVYSMAYGVSSDTAEYTLNQANTLTGSSVGKGSVIAVIILAVILIGGAAVIIIVRKKKKNSEPDNADTN